VDCQQKNLFRVFFSTFSDWPAPLEPTVASSVNGNIDDSPVSDYAPMSCFSSTANENPLDWSRYSSFQKLKRIVAYIRRLLPKTRRVEFSSASINTEELHRAEINLFALAQRESFAAELTCRAADRNVSAKSRLAPLSPFLGADTLLRSKGRLSKMQTLCFDTRHPVLLDGHHPLVKLFLRSLHNEHHHEGVEFLRSVVQQRFWVLRLRSVLRSLKHACVLCRKFSASPLHPEMAALPSERLGYRQVPFANTGVDYFGPFSVSVRRSSAKRWCFLFTCLTTRAVHIEIVPSMSTDSCLLGIRRFIARRGKPRVIRSDNGTNFVGADKELHALTLLWNQNQLQSELAQECIQWKFNPPSAPHHGGSWERLVRSCKRSAYAVLGSRRLTDEVLSTVMCMVEQNLNSRPLVPASSDVTDLEALTPNHFLLGRPSVSLPWCLSDEKDFCHRKAYVRAEAYATSIWSRWLREYVPSLNVRQKWRFPEHQLKTGDLVWIVEPTTARGHYPLARVVFLRYAPDGVARSARVRTSTGELVRPVCKLSPVFDFVLESKNRAGHVSDDANSS
jgi:hypothetical protein